MVTATAAHTRQPSVWWLLLLHGIAALLLGLMLVSAPAATLASLMTFIGFFWLISGVLSVVRIFVDRSVPWIWSLLSGVVGILAGLFVVNHPLIAALVVPATLVVILGIDGLAMGVFEIIRGVKGGGIGAFVLGAANILIGVLLLARPFAETLCRRSGRALHLRRDLARRRRRADLPCVQDPAPTSVNHRAAADRQERISMMGTTTPKLMLGLVAIAAALTATLPAVSAQNAAVEEFTAFAINVNSRPVGMSSQPGANRPTTATLTIRIERWSNDEERNGLLTILKGEQNVNRANQALLRAMQRLDRVGTIRESSSLAWDLRYARQSPLPEGGRQIILATDRPIGFWEARNQPRTIDYPFTIVEMRLNKANQGEGKMLADTQVSINPTTNDLVLEHYDISPVRLNQIRRRN